VLALVAGCFAAMPLSANATPTPAAGQPSWDAKYSPVAECNQRVGVYYDRGNASGDKISSNAHSGDYPGVYFRWDDKQKMPGVFLVEAWVFDLFVGETFFLTAKNSNSYYKYEISRETGKVKDGVYVYGIPKEVMAKDNKGNDKKDELKNINMVFIDGNYKSAYFTISKVWQDENGNVVTGDNNLVTFKENKAWKVGDKIEVKITDYTTAVKGKKVTITENSIAGFTTKTNPISLTVRYDDCPLKNAEFVNQKQFAKITIVKNWVDVEGLPTSGNGVTFDIIGARATLTTVRGAIACRTYDVKEGTYRISENAIEGWELIEVEGADSVDADGVATITVVAGGKYTVTFTNQEDEPQEIGRKLTKYVDGLRFDLWIDEKYTGDVAELIRGMRFDLYEKLADGSTKRGFDVPVATGVMAEDSGIIDFSREIMAKSVTSGWYYVVETLSGTAQTVFGEEADAIRVYIEVKGSNVVIDIFDYNSLYTIVNGYNSPKHNAGLGYPGLNNGGDLFYIGVKNQAGMEYPSFCAHGGSKNFAGESGLGCTGYMIVQRADMVELENPEMAASYEDILSALNWIETNVGVGGLTATNGPYGLVTTQRVVAQTVIWALLGNIDVESEAFANTNLTAEERDFVMSALEAVADGYKGNIVDLVYLVCEKHDHAFETCQPQLVPVYDKPEINNKVKETFGVTFMKTKYGEKLSVEDGEFRFDLFEIVGGAEELIGTFPTDGNDVVVATELKPGSYVFREVWTTVFTDGLGYDDFVGSYNLVWKAIYPNGDAGLYFTIDAQGNIHWPEGYLVNDNDVPIVDNVIHCKHSVLWVVDGFVPEENIFHGAMEVINLGAGKGQIIIFEDWCDGILGVVETKDPTCQEHGILWLGCTAKCGIGVGIEFGDLCDHDIVYLAIVSDGEHDGWVWFGGQNGCICGGKEYNLKKWFELGGYDFGLPE